RSGSSSARRWAVWADWSLARTRAASRSGRDRGRPCSQAAGLAAWEHAGYGMSGDGPLPHPAGVSHVSAVEVVVELLRRESGLRVDGLQQRSVLGRGTAAEIVRGERQVLSALLPGARTVPDRRGVERIELRAVRRVHAVRAGVPVAERRVELRVRGLDAGQVGLERDG